MCNYSNYSIIRNLFLVGIHSASLQQILCIDIYVLLRIQGLRRLLCCFFTMVSVLFIVYATNMWLPFLFCAVSCYSMFPLLFEPQEYPIKVLLLAIHSILMWIGFSSCFRVGIAPGGTKTNNSSASNGKQGFIGKFGTIYLLGLLGVELWGQLLHPYIFGSRLPFLPLMLISIYCAAGMMYSWVWQLRQILKCS